MRKVFGNTENVFIANLKPGDAVDPGTLDWINPNRPDKQKIAEETKARVIIAGAEVGYSKNMHDRGKTLLIADNPKLAIAKVGHEFSVPKVVPGIHQIAYVHPEERLGENIFIGADATVGKCRIGDNVTIYPNVVIADDVIIGSSVTIKAGAIIGFHGFGYEKDDAGNWMQFVQLGQLIIDDNVEIGSNTCIDRGSLSSTRIGFNLKIDNLCHIAHNVMIGKNVIIVAHSIICGSTTIEDNVWIAPNATIIEHKIVGKGATIGMGAVVRKDVPAGETWVGNPGRKIER